MNVLFIDDDIDMRVAMTYLAKAAHAGVTAVASFEELVRMDDLDRFDAIAVDYMLPDSSGIAILTWLRNRLPGTPMCLFSASEHGGRAALEKAGFDPPVPFVLKGFAWDALLDAWGIHDG